jgi:hypothetical protein
MVRHSNPRSRSPKFSIASVRQHVLESGCELLPCASCGDATRPPLVSKPFGRRRTVQCLACGAFFAVDATLSDAKIAAAWDARNRA